MKRVFYCDDCADKRRWPWQITRIKGSCEFCGKEGFGSSTPESVLPRPPKPIGQLTFRFKVENLIRGEDGPEICQLDGCKDPKIQPHHHHKRGTWAKTAEICQCLNIDIPGTRTKET